MKINCVAICLSVALTVSLLMLCRIPPATCDDWSSSCASNCTCKWTNGKKSAICSSLQLNTVPATLSTELQVLVLNDNRLAYLNREEFTQLGLLNLQRIYMKKSEIQYVHKEAFKDLKILVEVDLSDNKIEMLDVDTFQGNDRLRILYLNGNPLKRLVAYQFPVLPHLRTLDLHDCLLSFIDPLALANLNQLEFLYLKNNLLESLSEYVFQHMANLKTLALDDNPWQCNCKLRKFRSWYVRSRLNSISLSCQGPPAQKQRPWEQVTEEKFGCLPRVELFNLEDVQNIDIGSNTTFSCLVYGDPLPEVVWELNGKLLDSDNVVFEAESVASDKLWSNVTIFNMTSQDAGTYACMGVNAVGAASQNISIYLTEIVQHVLVKTPETFWYFGLIMGTFGTVFLLILISFVVCLCKRTSRQRRHPSKPGGVKGSVSFNDQEKKLLDLSITTTTNDRGDSCGFENSAPGGMHKADSAVMGFEPIEVHSVEAHRQSHGHHGMLLGPGGHHQMTHQQQLLPNRAPLMPVPEGSCGVLGIPTSMAGNAVAATTHAPHLAEEFPLNVGVFPPPPEFCSNVVSNPAYGNIFISVSVTQDMLDSSDLSMYPDLLNIPQRLQDNGAAPVQSSCSSANTASTVMTTAGSAAAAAVNVSSFATLPRNGQRRGILKKDSSLQLKQQQQHALQQQQHALQQQQQQQQQANLYPHDEIVSYHNLDTSYSQGYQEHQQQQQLQRLHHASNIVGLPMPLPPPSVSNAAATAATASACAGCLNSLPNSACSTPPIEATPLRPLCKANTSTNTCLKYDNMGRRITASGNSILSLPDEERLENETLFNAGNPSTFVTNNNSSNNNSNSQKDAQQMPNGGSSTLVKKSAQDAGGTDFVSL